MPAATRGGEDARGARGVGTHPDILYSIKEELQVRRWPGLVLGESPQQILACRSAKGARLGETYIHSSRTGDIARLRLADGCALLSSAWIVLGVCDGVRAATGSRERGAAVGDSLDGRLQSSPSQRAVASQRWTESTLLLHIRKS